jgi:hypothetical protein
MDLLYILSGGSVLATARQRFGSGLGSPPTGVAAELGRRFQGFRRRSALAARYPIVRAAGETLDT